MTARLMAMAKKPAAGGGGSSFDPLSISWHAAYWAEDPNWTNPGDGNNVTQWDDGSAQSFHLVRDGTKPLPSYAASAATLNSKPAIRFDGTGANGETLEVDFTLSGSINQPNHIFAVFDITGNAADSNETVVDGFNSTVGRHLVRPVHTSGLQVFAGTSVVGGTSVTNGGHAMLAIFNGASTDLKIDNVSVLSGNAGSQALRGLQLGSDVDGNNSMDGHIAFLGVKDGALTAQEQSDLWAWAQGYYGTP